jgi:hypothetical protein
MRGRIPDIRGNLVSVALSLPDAINGPDFQPQIDLPVRSEVIGKLVFNRIDPDLPLATVRYWSTLEANASASGAHTWVPFEPSKQCSCTSAGPTAG